MTLKTNPFMDPLTEYPVETETDLPALNAAEQLVESCHHISRCLTVVTSLAQKAEESVSSGSEYSACQTRDESDLLKHNVRMIIEHVNRLMPATKLIRREVYKLQPGDQQTN